MISHVSMKVNGGAESEPHTGISVKQHWVKYMPSLSLLWCSLISFATCAILIELRHAKKSLNMTFGFGFSCRRITLLEFQSLISSRKSLEHLGLLKGLKMEHACACVMANIWTCSCCISSICMALWHIRAT